MEQCGEFPFAAHVDANETAHFPNATTQIMRDGQTAFTYLWF
jgi:hypothetical protein